MDASKLAEMNEWRSDLLDKTMSALEEANNEEKKKNQAYLFRLFDISNTFIIYINAI